MEAEGRDAWLVVAATQAQIVNVLPAVAVGLGSIDRILVLVGLDPDAADGAADKAHAIAPLPRLWNALAHEAQRAGLNSSPAHFELQNDKNDLGGWQSRVRQFFAGQRNVGRITYIYTGGTTDMSIGTWFGLTQAKQDCPRIELEFIAKHANRILFRHAPERSIELRGGRNRLSLEGYLQVNGFTEHDGPASLLRAEQAVAREQVTHALGTAVFEHAAQQISDACTRLLTSLDEQKARLDLDRAITPLLAKFREGAGILSAASEKALTDFAANLRTLLAPLAGVTHVPTGRLGTLAFDSQEVARYVKSFWFEEWIWLRVRAALADTPAEVRLGLGVRQADSINPSQQDYDIDVAVYSNDQLHAVECKVRQGKSDEVRAAIDRASRVRKALLGPYGRSFVCRGPSLSAASRAVDQAERVEIDQIAGRGEIEKMLKTLRALVG